MNVREEDLAVFEIEEAADAAAGGDGFEEAGGGLVGVDAGGDEEADDAVGFGQAHGALDEEGVEVDVAAAEKWVVVGGADELAEAVGAQFGGVEIGGEGVALLAQLLDAAAAGGGGGGEGEIRGAGGEPFDLLQLDAVPGRVADDGVEAAGGLVVLPAAPDAGEGDFPVEEGFAVGDLFGAVPDLGVLGPQGVLSDGVGGVDVVGAVGQQGKGLFLLRDDYRLKRRFEFGALLLFHAGGEPVDAAECVEEAAKRGGRFFDLAEEGGRFFDFGNVSVGHLFDTLHAGGCVFGGLDGAGGGEAAEA